MGTVRCISRRSEITFWWLSGIRHGARRSSWVQMQQRRQCSSTRMSRTVVNSSGWPDEVFKSKTGLPNDHFGLVVAGERPVPKYFNFSKDVFEPLGKHPATGDGCSLWYVSEQGQETQFSYHEMLVWSQVVARFLRDECHLKPLGRILVILPRIPEWWALNLAAIQCGLIAIPGTVQLTAADVAKRILASGATALFCDGATAEKLLHASPEEFPPHVWNHLEKCVIAGNSRPASGMPENWRTVPPYGSEDLLPPLKDYFKSESSQPCNMYFTSGTTGLPKLTVHTHVSYGLAHWSTGRIWSDSKPGDSVWNLSDTGWAKAAYSSFYAPWIVGATIFAAEMAQFSSKIALDTLVKYPITVMCCPPTAMRTLVQEDLKAAEFKKLRLCVSGGEPLNPEVIAHWEAETGVPLMEGYGQTETTLSAGSLPGYERRPSSMGKGLPGFQFVVVSEDGTEVQRPHKEGILALDLRHGRKPVGLFSGYAENQVATAAVFKNGFYLSGDRAHMDEDGFIYFVSRADDVIISSGYRIGPFEVESALIEHPAVAESAVVASPHPVRGEIVKAFIVLSAAYKDIKNMGDEVTRRELVADIQNHVKRVTAPYKYPREVEFVDTLPKTISGKIRRVELRNAEFRQSSSTAAGKT